MIVCVCNNISEHKIRHAVNAGTTSMRELHGDLGLGNCCGKCNSCAKTILHESLAARSSSAALALAA